MAAEWTQDMAKSNCDDEDDQKSAEKSLHGARIARLEEENMNGNKREKLVRD